VYAVLQGRREPAIRPGSVIKAWFAAVAQICGSSAAPHLPARCECLADLAPAVHQVDQTQDRRAGGYLCRSRVDVLDVAHQRQAGCFAARVQLDAQRLQSTSFHRPVGEPNHKGYQAVHARSATCQQ